MSTRSKQARLAAADDCPLVWFALLVRARRDKNTGMADRALRELERLGIQVTYTRPAAGEARRAS